MDFHRSPNLKAKVGEVSCQLFLARLYEITGRTIAVTTASASTLALQNAKVFG